MSTEIHSQILAARARDGMDECELNLREQYFSYSQEDVDATSRFNKGWPQAEHGLSSRVAIQPE